MWINIMSCLVALLRASYLRLVCPTKNIYRTENMRNDMFYKQLTSFITKTSVPVFPSLPPPPFRQMLPINDLDHLIW